VARKIAPWPQRTNKHLHILTFDGIVVLLANIEGKTL